ncbi:Sterol O-acyltransferase 2 (Sterol-ester synthase 2) [Sporothrix eucalyptigena]|uniref:Sterol O-acyltransferase 2 (Sterol-ester synthase 2) n=1 Tax=Sporothrix eucalyptigena TaxID=1812306 RepID=A0ABP0ANT7_9PEZI
MVSNDIGPEEGATANVTGARQQRPRALQGVFTNGAEGTFSSDASFTASESPSEEDYDELTSRPSEAMVLRQRRKTQTQLRKEVHPDTDDASEATPRKASSPLLPIKSPPRQHLTSAAGLSQEASPTSRTQKGGRKLSATVIFEEKGRGLGAPISSATTAVSSTASIDGEAASQKDGPGHSFVVSIDDPKLAEILRADLEQMREDLEEKRRLQQAPSEAGESVPGEGSIAGDKKVLAPGSDGIKQRRGSASSRPKHRAKKHRGRFSDFVFTRGFSTFDRQNADAANSPFHGFFTLFWISVFVFMVKIGAENWRKTGSPLGTNEIMANMFHRDLVVMLASDGVLCALTGVSWLIQLIVFDGRLMEWDGAGWIVQNVWQTLYVAGFIGWTQLRDWPWSHTVFFVLHGLVMLMKQHSYAFYNGYLSSIYKRRAVLQSRLEDLQRADLAMGDAQNKAWTSGRSASDAALASAARTTAVVKVDELGKKSSSHTALDQSAVSTVSPEALDKVVEALQSGQPLDLHQVRVFDRILHWEIDGLSEELRGKSTRPDKAYPHNLTFTNHYEYIVLPTLVYELEYPRSETINWRYAAEKLVAVFGIIFVMIMVSQAFMYPVVMRTVAMKEAGMPLAERFKEFPWMLSDLIFPFMMEYLLTWYLIWETILNFLAEITYFADRSFYSAWWNSVTWDEFARDWNRPVHLFLLRHVYHSSISAMKVNKHTATLITFFLSACVHELVMWCIFKKLRGYLLFLQMCQLPLVRLSRIKWMRNRQTLGNIMFWGGIFVGPTILCSLYLIL